MLTGLEAANPLAGLLGGLTGANKAAASSPSTSATPAAGGAATDPLSGLLGMPSSISV
jgi:hypothetical protein